MVIISNKEKFIEGLKKRKYTIKNAHRSLKSDRDVLLLCAFYDRANSVLKEGLKQGFNDLDFISEVLLSKPSDFKYLSKSLKNNEEFLLSLFEKGCSIFKLIPNKFSSDINFVKKAVSLNGLAVRDVQRQFLEDRDVCFLAVQNNPIAYKFIYSDYRKDPDLASLALSRKPELFFWLPEELKNNAQVIKSAFSSDPDITFLLYKDKVPKEVKQMVDVAAEACNSNINCLLHVPANTFLSEDFKAELANIVEAKQKEILSNSTNAEEDLNAFNEHLAELLARKEELVVKELEEEKNAIPEVSEEVEKPLETREVVYQQVETV